MEGGESRTRDELHVEMVVTCRSSRPKKYSVSLVSGVLRVWRPEKEKLNRAVAGASVTEIVGGRLEIKFSGSGGGSGGTQARGLRRSPRWTGKKREAEVFVLWPGAGERETWLGALSEAAATGARKTSDPRTSTGSNGSGGELATATHDPAEQTRLLLEMAGSQARFWEERGVRQLPNMIMTSATSPDVLLLASKILYGQSQLLAVKQSVLSVDFVAAVSRLLSDASIMSHCAACYALLTVLVSEGDGCSQSYCDLLAYLVLEFKIGKSLIHLLVLEEDNMPESVQELVLHCLCNMSWNADMRDALLGSEVLLRYLRVCLSLDQASPILLLVVKLLANLALLPSFRDALSEEFDVSDVLVNLYCVICNTNKGLAVAVCKTLANVCIHPFIASQMVQSSRLTRLKERLDGEGLVMAVLTNVCLATEISIPSSQAEALVTLPVVETTFEAYVRLLAALSKKCAVSALLRKHRIVENVFQKYQQLVQVSHKTDMCIAHFDLMEKK